MSLIRISGATAVAAFLLLAPNLSNPGQAAVTVNASNNPSRVQTYATVDRSLADAKETAGTNAAAAEAGFLEMYSGNRSSTEGHGGSDSISDNEVRMEASGMQPTTEGRGFSVFCVSLVTSLALMLGIFGLFFRKKGSGS
ncbi:hypothetical protein [Saccharibacillus kuerlensis]|uniref:Uncharacterized protein n=1 Tax=Saccharibacillus kuerlensis TaxID=459527 RepID=A0ABQ2L297_9BACL|nr:hypothetical protein [Saccharibacillus kuerlensis]GGN99925.1 hypothetical protein GCM10010969_20560 [Saccharibacillus kuerlensis]